VRDPAIEAAQRVWDEIEDNDATFDPVLDIECAELVDAAREALAPIRERHRPYDRPIYGSAQTERVCRHCLGPIKWPCPDARDAYSSEELER
jgi:hypothetical protein